VRYLLLALALAGCAGRDVPPAAPADPAPTTGDALVLLAPRQVTLMPVAEAGARRLWRGGGVALETEGARVVAAAGLGPVLTATRFDTPDPLRDPRALVGREVPARRAVDLSGADREPGSMRFGVALDCTLRGREEAGAILVEERCVGEGVGFTNRFRADAATGRIDGSEQWVGNGIAPLVLRGGFQDDRRSALREAR